MISSLSLLSRLVKEFVKIGRHLAKFWARVECLVFWTHGIDYNPDVHRSSWPTTYMYRFLRCWTRDQHHDSGHWIIVFGTYLPLAEVCTSQGVLGYVLELTVLAEFRQSFTLVRCRVHYRCKLRTKPVHSKSRTQYIIPSHSLM